MSGPRQHDYELLPRTSLEAQDLPALPRSLSTPSWLRALSSRLPGVKTLCERATYTRLVAPRRRRRSLVRAICYALFAVLYLCAFLVLIAGIFFPSYTTRPAHYLELQQRAANGTEPGRANPFAEKVFIAASLYEDKGQLTSGAWARSVLQLIDLLGPDNVHLSVYEDNPTEAAKHSLASFRQNLTCKSTIVAEPFDAKTLPRVTLPTGKSRLKRIAFLAEVRNRALAPIDQQSVRFDKILYLNDVNFHPIEAAQLLFATNVDSAGRTDYGAACAFDYINAFKFYDRFATRDYDGRVTGVPFFPYFTSAGTATSRNDMLSQTDAVRVRSCWGGMVAYEAHWFQDQTRFEDKPANATSSAQHTSPDPARAPLRFRYEEDVFWDASECCLINADLQYRRTGRGMPADSGIYVNPYIRVAYDEKTLSWLNWTRRPERLYSIFHDILNHMVGFPSVNARMGDEPGQTVTDTVWEYEDPSRGFAHNATRTDLAGHWAKITRTAKPGSYCGSPNLLVMNEGPEDGEGRWRKMPVPRPPKA
ncbi:uncharacterized protein EKO05_0011242 [Ascochyta rabiei]|uniref:Uncharacterized protein n=1 Tax=Didymella rabiei TaxID=5454 RepID=A0A163E6F3_DIDRA|nr:uncharacterized protein EKO05_0011242 [Ascochyta rabiei]KZM23542.1 hypothetical protein ST47_g5319 [Ascochyta rabiei]UPX21036.1 hypothetical protein EKO05_0011242 [Ascochyta rabiei]